MDICTCISCFVFRNFSWALSINNTEVEKEETDDSLIPGKLNLYLVKIDNMV